MRRTLKAWTKHLGLMETVRVRRAVDVAHRKGWPYCPGDEGDVLFLLARNAEDALEIGFATGSTGAYILEGLGRGTLTSVDWRQDEYERAGEQLISRLGQSGRHRLLEADSITVLPELYRQGCRFGLVFLDGWKSFDRIWVDTFYSARMLKEHGFIMFDDARMPAVRKCIRLLMRYYGFRLADNYRLLGGWRLRAWHILSGRSLSRPYVVLEKALEITETDAGKRFDFWRRF